MTPYISDPDFTLYVGDVTDILQTLPDESVHCVITSPPYFGLRDYNTDGQIGLEATPELYVARMVEVFAEVRRVLRRDGSVWLNLGDSHADKQLQGMPWRVAFALQAAGWILRSDIIWSKPNPMPESVTDRPTKAHEYLFLLTKSARYFYDQDAIREPHQDKQGLERFNGSGGSTPDYKPAHQGWVDGGGFTMQPGGRDYNPSGRNKRSVWEVATEPYPDAHFATYPQALIEPCIKAGCPEHVCQTCGKPRERITDVTQELLTGNKGRATQKPDANNWEGVQNRTRKHVETVGWSDCGHNNYQPGIVLDPFLGSGTTALVARKHSRHSIGIELNQAYAELAAKRLNQLSLLTGDAA